MRAEVLSGSSSFSIQFSVCREPHKWRTSGTRRVLAGRGVRFPILFARTLTAVSVSTRTRVPGSPRAPHAPPGLSFPEQVGSGAPGSPPRGASGVAGLLPLQVRGGGRSVARLCLLKRLCVLWLVGSAASPGRGARFPAGTGLWEGPLRRKCQPSGWLFPLAPWAAAPSREGKSEMEETPLPTRQSSS